MNKIRFYLALYAAKGAQLAMKILGRNATFLPGKLAIKLCPHFLRYLNPPKTVVGVTGTNGKTTVSNLLTSILRKNGFSVTNNSLGSNVQAGVISALIEDTTWFNRPKKDIAILEVDERSSLLIYPDLPPHYLVCNNLMRDSNKRNAHTEFISYIIRTALPSTTHLVLNADDMVACTLAKEGQKCTYFGLDAEIPQERTPQLIQDIVYCPDCGGILDFEYVRYNHIGRMFCPSCGKKAPERDFRVTDIDRVNDTFTVTCGDSSYTYNLINDNIVNVYNFCGAIALLTRLGLGFEQINKGFADSEIVKSRFDTAKSGDLNITLIMSKGQNPIACTRCLDYASKAAAPNKGVILMLDDISDNTGDSENICWVYDCDYRYLTDPSIAQVVFAGPRCHDHYLRGLMAGVPAEKMLMSEDVTEGPKLIDTSVCKDIFVLHDLYRNKDAAATKKYFVQRGQEGV